MKINVRQDTSAPLSFLSNKVFCQKFISFLNIDEMYSYYATKLQKIITNALKFVQWFSFLLKYILVQQCKCIKYWHSMEHYCINKDSLIWKASCMLTLHVYMCQYYRCILQQTSGRSDQCTIYIDTNDNENKW